MSEGKDYHYYVIKNGNFIGKFEGMYQNSSDIPWPQDETANGIFTDIDLIILKHFQKQEDFQMICEIGCGMGYVADRINRELVNIDVTGFDISATDVEKAQTMFLNINFEVFDIIKNGTFTLANRQEGILAAF
ncbi:MAG: class I SAM-dependent methyltransferase [Bacteroidales bacterium]|nr:class I SAM-dependent methyltransferase [Bacteroidales bacterium]